MVAGAKLNDLPGGAGQVVVFVVVVAQQLELALFHITALVFGPCYRLDYALNVGHGYAVRHARHLPGPPPVARVNDVYNLCNGQPLAQVVPGQLGHAVVVRTWPGALRQELDPAVRVGARRLALLRRRRLGTRHGPARRSQALTLADKRH